MRIVIDTNLLIAALTHKRGASARLVKAWREGQVEVVASEATVREAELVLGGGWLSRLAPPAEVQRLLEDLRTNTVWVKEPPEIKGLRMKDPGDLRVAETAVAGSARYVVTTDREFLSHRGYGDVEFITPQEFWRVASNRG